MRFSGPCCARRAPTTRNGHMRSLGDCSRPSLYSYERTRVRWRHHGVSRRLDIHASAPEHETQSPIDVDPDSIEDSPSVFSGAAATAGESPLAQGIKNLNRKRATKEVRTSEGVRPRPVDPFLGPLEDPKDLYVGTHDTEGGSGARQGGGIRRARGSTRSGKKSEFVASTPVVSEPPEEDASTNAIEADAVFDPDTDPSTHVLPPEFHFRAAEESKSSYTTSDTPPSFFHDATKAPEPSEEPPIDPLDPDFIAQTIADSSIYEDLYNEFGMGEQFPPDSDDEAEREDSTAEQDEAEEDQISDEERRRRSEVLLELASATPQSLEKLISKHYKDIDELLLEQLYERIQVAKRFEEGSGVAYDLRKAQAYEGDDVVEGLMLLFQRLRNEAERKTSTPAMRLLDDLLVIMDADTGSSEAARLESAAERMDMAFDPNGGQDGIDIFAVAAALGEGATRAVDEVIIEFVPRPAFVEEVQKLLEGAEERSEVLQMQLEQRELNFEDGLEAKSYTPSEERAFREELRQFKSKLEYSLTSVRWCTAFLRYAQGKEMGTEASTPPEATGRKR